MSQKQFSSTHWLKYSLVYTIIDPVTDRVQILKNFIFLSVHPSVHLFIFPSIILLAIAYCSFSARILDWHYNWGAWMYHVIIVIFQICIVSGGGGNITCEFEVVEDHRNTHGTLHGGLMSLLVDAVTSWALHTKIRDRNSASIDLSLRYNYMYINFLIEASWLTPSNQP